MQSRPTFIDITPPGKSSSKEPRSVEQHGTTTPRALLSPRVQHFDGDIPPAMSPLDMFAAQSRLLARQLDEVDKDGRPVSRLPPLTTDDPIARSLYARTRTPGQSPQDSPRQTTPNEVQDDIDASGSRVGFQDPNFRPRSFYPRMSHVAPNAGGDADSADGRSERSASITSVYQDARSSMEIRSPKILEYFDSPKPRAGTPPRRYDHRHERSKVGNTPSPRANPPRMELPPKPPSSGSSGQARTRYATGGDSVNHKNGASMTLAPQNAPSVRQPSIRSVNGESSDEENSASTNGSGFSRNRKLSSSSNMSMPNSPFVPFAVLHERTPSMTSEFSMGGTRLARPAYNFSRPLSRASQPSVDLTFRPSFDGRPSAESSRPPFTHENRQISNDSQRRVSPDDQAPVRPSFDTDRSLDFGVDGADSPAPSYIYTKYSLPRGRTVQKDCRVLQKNEVPLFEYSQPHVQSNVQPIASSSPNSPTSMNFPAPRSEQTGQALHSSQAPGAPKSRHAPQPSIELHRASPRSSLELHDDRQNSPRPSIDRGKSPNPSEQKSGRDAREQLKELRRASYASSSKGDDASYQTMSSWSTSTVKAPSQPTPAPTSADPLELTPDQHLSKGIALHERGASREATYHWRVAAKKNVPHAMLLYALACRHGWGMRPNQGEAVQWLRRAADCASLEIADEEDQNRADIAERKKQRAQFALSVYELGQSHYNGWGTEQDRQLALKCFEIAAGWGDTDAMQEAGFCYANGEGCKKDMKKAAKFYRTAESKGISMIGQSWIHKPKYADATSLNDSGREGRRGKDSSKSNTTTPDKSTGRDKSRTRTIFGRRKSVSHH